MKKQRIGLLWLLVTGSVLFSSYQNGVFTADYTGSANTSTTHCAQSGCHNSIGFMGDGLMQIQVLSGGTPVMSYSPGSIYTIQVKRPVNVSKVGFQTGVFNWASSTPVGTIANNIMPTKLQVNTVTGGQMLSHTVAGSTTAIASGMVTYQYQWTAPPVDVGAIDVYAIMNLSNSDGTRLGDSIMRGIFTLQKPNAIPECYGDTTQVYLYPNPVQHTLNLQIPGRVLSSEVTLISVSGAVLRLPLKALGGQSYSIDMSACSSGWYTLRLPLSNGTFIRTFIKSSF